MKGLLMLTLMLLACGAEQDRPSDALCGASELTEKAGDPLSFGRYGGLRTRGELWEAIERAAARWRAATCLDVDVSLAAETWVRWRVASEMGTATGSASGPFNDARIHMRDDADEEVVEPVLVHEMGHILRRSYGHPGPDGSMSFPVTHVFSEPVSRITSVDTGLVCDMQANQGRLCGCDNPED